MLMFIHLNAPDASRDLLCRHRPSTFLELVFRLINSPVRDASLLLDLVASTASVEVPSPIFLLGQLYLLPLLHLLLNHLHSDLPHLFQQLFLLLLLFLHVDV